VNEATRRAIEQVTWKAAIYVAADEIDRAEREIGGEKYRRQQLDKNPGGHSAMACRILMLLDCTAPVSDHIVKGDI
jgi:hypothetical protein